MGPLKEWLTKNEITQSTLAMLAGVDHSHVCRVVNGQGKPSKKLRQYIESIDNKLAAAHDAWLTNRLEEIASRLENAA